ncbi:MAG: PAS-domain containing protein [Cypionkella sp.]|nr:PAS-domain containing protein [Cypionkella sp.]
MTSILSAFGAGLVLSGLKGRDGNQPKGLFHDRSDGTIFLFDGDVLIDASPSARALLSGVNIPSSAWSKLMAYIEPLFPEAARHLADLQNTGLVVLEGEDSDSMPIHLRAEWVGGLTRIALIDAESLGKHPLSDPLVHRAMSEELSVLRGMLTDAPMLAWREREDGEVIWANTGYVLTSASLLEPGRDLTWPLPRLFDRIATAQGAAGQRQRILRPDGAERWFDLTVVHEGSTRKIFALPCDGAVNAEASLRDLMQTLTRTFAHLPTGLAVFDRNRKLQLFNPALVDLTGLPPDFLSSRPTVLAMLDLMRDRNMVPEPKDYRRWRDQFVAIEAQDGNAEYQEMWNLAGGQTYKVVGRPQANGSMALMFEDISGEMMRTRRFYANLELSQSVIDSIDEAMAVFSETGQVVMLNEAYARLWGHDPSEKLSESGIRQAATHWAQHTAPGTLWSEAEDFVATVGDRICWQMDARLNDGRMLNCRFQPLSGGATLIGFRVARTDPAPSPSELARPRRRA